MAKLRELGRDIDQLLRGGFTRSEDLATGRFRVPARTLLVAGVVLGALYGVFMGLYAALRGGDGSAAQLFATTVKVPLLFLLTFAITFPSLYVISTLAGSRLDPRNTVRLVLAAVVVNLALLASLGPVTGFFTLSTTSYSFMVVLNVLFFGVAGVVGLVFLARALEGLFEASAQDAEPATEAAEPPEDESDGHTGEDAPEEAEAPSEAAPPSEHPATWPSPRPTYRPPPPRRGRSVFFVWLLVFSVVGAQMGWILRPFIGSPHVPFSWFRERQSNFFEAFFQHLANLFS